MSSLRTLIVALLGLQLCAPGTAAAQLLLDDPAVTPVRHEAVLVFEPASGKQHLVYRLRYRGSAAPRVLLPVPAVPKLGEGDDRLFDALDDLADRSRPPAPGYRLGRLSLLWDFLSPIDDGPAAPPAGPGPVRRAASSRAFAPDAQADLTAWAGGAAAPGWLADLGAAYQKAGWSQIGITPAAAAAAPAATGEQRLRPVVASFSAEQPLYPFRRPPAAPLRLYVITTARVDGRLGSEREVPWPGRTAYARHLQVPDQNALGHLLGPGVILPPEPFLTILVTDGQPAAATGTADLHFNPEASQRWVLPPRPESRSIPFPSELVVIGLIWWLVQRSRRPRPGTAE